jgi:uncharacterized protein (DUF433 family)
MNQKTAVKTPEVIVEGVDDPWPEWEPLVDWTVHIHQDPNILVGKPVVRGTRLSAEFLLELFASGWTEEQILTEYTQVSRDALRAVLAFAAQCVRERYPVARPDGSS